MTGIPAAWRAVRCLARTASRRFSGDLLARERTHPLDVPRRDDALERHAELLDAGRAVLEEVELAGRVRVGVEGEVAAGVDRLADEIVGRVAAFGARIDLDGDAVLGACSEHGLGIERRRWADAAFAVDEAAGAVPEDRRVGVLDGAEHAFRHGSRARTQLGVNRRDPHVEAVEHVGALVEGAVLLDVYLDALEQDERGARRPEGRVHRVDDAELLRQPLGTQPVGDAQRGGVVGLHDVLAPEGDRCHDHLVDR